MSFWSGWTIYSIFRSHKFLYVDLFIYLSGAGRRTEEYLGDRKHYGGKRPRSSRREPTSIVRRVRPHRPETPSLCHRDSCKTIYPIPVSVTTKVIICREDFSVCCPSSLPILFKSIACCLPFRSCAERSYRWNSLIGPHFRPEFCDWFILHIWSRLRLHDLLLDSTVRFHGIIPSRLSLIHSPANAVYIYCITHNKKYDINTLGKFKTYLLKHTCIILPVPEH